MKGLRVLELSEALNVDSSDLLAVSAILKIKATSRLSMLSFEIPSLMLFPISFANKLFVQENIEKTNTHKNNINFFIKIIYLILSSYTNSVIWKNLNFLKQI